MVPDADKWDQYIVSGGADKWDKYAVSPPVSPPPKKGFLQALGEGPLSMERSSIPARPAGHTLGSHLQDPSLPRPDLSELWPGPGTAPDSPILNAIHRVPLIGPGIAGLGEEFGSNLPAALGHTIAALATPTSANRGMTVDWRFPLKSVDQALPEISPGAGKFIPDLIKIPYNVLNAGTKLRPQWPVRTMPMLDRGTPDWANIKPMTEGPAELESIPSLLPSGRPLPPATIPPKPAAKSTIGPRVVPPLGPQSRTPLWTGVTEPEIRTPPAKIQPIEGALPSERAVGKPDPFVGPVKPIEPIESISNKTASAPTVKSVKHPASHTDLLRQLHANAQDFELPGSAAGMKGTQQLRNAAKTIFGVDSLKELSYDQAFVLNEYMLRRKQGIKTSLPQSKADLIQGLQE